MAFLGSPTATKHLTLDYRASQPTGWEAPYTPTLGGHIASKQFAYRGKSYRISLLDFGQTGAAPDPMYENVPTDSSVEFRRTLDRAWGKYYSFKYVGGISAKAKFTV